MNISALSKYLKTNNDAFLFIDLIRDLSSSLFRSNLTSSEIFKSKLSHEMQALLTKMMTDAAVNPENKESVKNFLQKITDAISTLPVVHLILAKEPKQKTIDAVQNWLFVNYKKLVILDITTDKSLIAGAVVSYGGRANDYSLKNTLTQARL